MIIMIINVSSCAHFVLQTNLMILYLEAVNYKVVTALATLEGHPPAASNTFSQHIETTRDKNGLQMSVLKVRTHADREHRRSLPPTRDLSDGRQRYRSGPRKKDTSIFYYCPRVNWVTTKIWNVWMVYRKSGNIISMIFYDSIETACNLIN